MIDGLGLAGLGPLYAPPRLDGPSGPSVAPEGDASPVSGGGDARIQEDLGAPSQLGLDQGDPPIEGQELDDGFLDALEEPTDPPVDDAAPPQDAAEARSKAEDIWFGENDASTDNFRTVERDAFDVNDQLGADPNRAAVQLIANQELETEALAKLSPQDRTAYNRVAKVTGSDPNARLALQVMLLDGTLTDPAKASSTGKNLVETLGTAATAPLARGINRKDFMTDMVKELAVPTAINQKNRATCTVTSIQIKTALERPAEYARILTGLASPHGKVHLASGKILTRSPGTNMPDDSFRSVTSRLWEPAMMDLGNGRFSYDNKTDSHVQAGSGLTGLGVQEVDRVMDAISGHDTQTRMLDILPAVRDQANSGKAVPVGVEWGDADASGTVHGAHEILVTQVTDDRVYYDNPWGKQESMSVAEFDQRAFSAQLDQAPVQGQPNPQADHDLAGNMAMVISNVDTVIKEFERADRKNNATKTSVTSYQATGVLESDLSLLRDLRQQLKGISLPSNPDEAQRKHLMDQLVKINGIATGMPSNSLGAGDTAVDLTAALRALK